MSKKQLQNSLNKHLFLLICILFSCLNSDAQVSKIDSLKASLKLTDNLEEKFKITTELTKLNTKTKPAIALAYAQESSRLAKLIKADSFLQRANLNLATVYLQLENYPKSVQYYYEVIHNSLNKPDPNVLFTAYVNLGTIYLLQNDYKNGIAKYTKALDYLGAKTERNLERKAGLLNNLGGAYKEIKDYHKATIYLNEALQLSKQIDDQSNIANILNNQGQVYQHLGKNDLALIHYLEAMKIREKAKDTIGIATSNYRLGQYYYSLGNYHAAEPYLKKVTSLKKDLGSLGILSHSSSYLYNIYKQQGKYKEALAAIELHKDTNDSLFNEARTRKIAQLEMQFEFDRKQSEQQTKQRERDLYSWLIAISLGLSLIIITLLFFLQKNKARRLQLKQAHLQLEKKNLEKDIELKDKELTTSILHLMQKNELIDHISEKLLKIKQNVDVEAQPAMQKVVTDLQSNLRPELLKEFEFRFQQVHENFYDILNEKFPNLSPSERKLCAFLKLNMTTKEISAITHQNIKSIEIARTRLRKKLNLTGVDYNLVTFLSQLDQA